MAKVICVRCRHKHVYDVHNQFEKPKHCVKCAGHVISLAEFLRLFDETLPLPIIGETELPGAAKHKQRRRKLNA